MNSYQKALDERKKQHLLRTLPLPPDGIDFYSNDYLGLAKSSELELAIKSALEQGLKQNGATGSRLLSGNSEYAEHVEQLIADFHMSESALIYSSGYTANLGLISCLATRETTLYCDELIHASLIDGARLGHSKRIRFSHNDPSDLDKKLKEHSGQKIVIVESIYSMDGDICPLNDIVEICLENGAQLIVDEAHSMAVRGEKGNGFVQELGLQDQVLARIMTYGKGPGIHGAAVVGPKWLKDYQVNFSRSMIFSTAPAAHQFCAIEAMYQLLPEIDFEREKLQSNISYFVEKRNKTNSSWLNSQSQIQSLIIPGNEQVVELGKKLCAAGINALPIRKPSIAEGSERIRFCLHSFNTKDEIDLLFKVLNNE
ncbi:8-amino-7-oxononanoate synthase [Ekhidna sp.]|uniref:aminotransferase class I/II-fold pyridoxal phosphate-dependent enzyme n=1 Tax=Ekhidna sp. TaxID=2608089 RepID=UPI003298446E